MDTFNWAILGLGNIARKFAEDLRIVDGAKLVAVGSRSLDRARAFAADFGAGHAGGSYQAALEGPRVDAVYIATPHIQHKELAMMCLGRGIPVLCEKPLGLNLAEVEQLASTARSEGVYLMEALWTRFLPSTLKVKELIDSGAIGEVQSIRSDFGFRANDLNVALDTQNPAPASAPDLSRNRILNPDLGGGALLDIGIYPQFLSQFLLGEPERITAIARLSPRGVDLDTSVTCVHAGGKLSHNYSTVLGRTKTEALILGTKASIHWHPRGGTSRVAFPSYAAKPTRRKIFILNSETPTATAMRPRRLWRTCGLAVPKTRFGAWTSSLALHRTLTRVRELIGVEYPGEDF